MKHQSSYSFFCCYCEETKRKERNDQRKRLENSSQISKIYKIDTNSNFSEKRITSPIQKNNIIINQINDKREENEKENKNYKLEDITTINSYNTINDKNIIKNKNITNKEEINNHNHKYKHKNFLQNDINSYLAKKEKKNIDIQNLSGIFKSNEKDNTKNPQIEKKVEEPKIIQNNEINKNNNIQNPVNIVNTDIINYFRKNNSQINNINSNKTSIKNEKDNKTPQTIRNINKFELEDKISQEQLLWKNKSNLNKSINSNIINTNPNLIQNNNIKEENNNKINSLTNNITKVEKNINPINNLINNMPINIDNDITCDKEKEEIPHNKEIINNDIKPIKSQRENRTIQQKLNSKFSSVNNDNNSFNSVVELKANLNNINQNLIKENKIIKKEEVNNIEEINDINNLETKRDMLDKTDVLESQSIKGNNNSNLDIKEGIKLNYLTEFYPSILKSENKKEEESKKSSIKKESLSEEIEDEVGSIDEFNNANDNRSILSSYIFSSVRPTESNKSFVSSIYGRSESQDLLSNYNEIMSNKGMRILPVDINNTNKEVEIKMDNLYRNSKNYFISMQMNQVRKMKEKIGEKEKQIKNNYDSIDKMKKKIEKMENEGRQYERWIEKEEEENENLIYLLNFLIECK